MIGAESALLVRTDILLLLPIVPFRRLLLGIGEEGGGGGVNVSARDLATSVLLLNDCDDLISIDILIDRDSSRIGSGDNVVVGRREGVRNDGGEIGVVNDLPGCRQFFAKFDHLRKVLPYVIGLRATLIVEIAKHFDGESFGLGLVFGTDSLPEAARSSTVDSLD